MTKMRKIKPINGHAMPSDMPEVYPSFHLDETQLPEIRDWKIGEEYTIQLKVRQTGAREGRSEEVMGEFEVLAVGVVDTKAEKKEKEYDGEKEA